MALINTSPADPLVAGIAAAKGQITALFGQINTTVASLSRFVWSNPQKKRLGRCPTRRRNSYRSSGCSDRF
jgi:hypothetical protein